MALKGEKVQPAKLGCSWTTAEKLFGVKIMNSDWTGVQIMNSDWTGVQIMNSDGTGVQRYK